MSEQERMLEQARSLAATLEAENAALIAEFNRIAKAIDLLDDARGHREYRKGWNDCYWEFHDIVFPDEAVE